MRILCLLVVGMIISSTNLMAQSDSITKIEFKYDAAGNRTDRDIVYYEGGLKSAKVVNVEEEIVEPEKGLNVYPNPASKSLFVTLNKEAMEEDNRKIILFDNLGKQIVQINATQEVNRVDVSSLANGTYILKLIYGNRHKEWIIIKN